MALRPVLVVLLLAALPLAGCLGAEEDAPAAAATDDEGANTTAPEGRGAIVAFEETNETEDGVGGVDHHHDMWNGAERVALFETQAAMEPFPSDENGAVATFRPPDLKFIYEGTASVEFTITNPGRHVCEPLVQESERYLCTDYTSFGVDGPIVPDPSPPQGLTLRYMHAATTQWIDAGQIAWDTPVSIKIDNPVQTDMPHATSSVWQFQVASPNAADVTLVFTAKADIVRAPGEEIPLWPGHPLFYDEERTSRIVVHELAAIGCDGSGCALAGGEAEPVVPEKIISYGTRTLYIWANITDYQAPNPATAPSNWFLYHSNATGRQNATDMFDMTSMSIDKRELFWVLPVDDGSMDSPYADGSRWTFQLGATYTTPENPVYMVAFYGGVAEWSAKYTLTVIATPEELAPEQYHLYCLQPDDWCGDEPAADEE